MGWLSLSWLRCYITITSITLLIFIYWWKTEECSIQNDSIINTTCRWPPRKISDIESNRVYNITICIQLNADAVNNEEPKRYLKSDLFNVPITNETVSFEELADLPRSIYKRAKYPDIYNTYPQDVPMKELVRNITTGRRVSYKPNYNFPIKILRTSRSVCSMGTRHDLIVVVKSGVYNLEARNEFRVFMRNQSIQNPTFKVGYVFSVGIPRAEGGRKFNRDGHHMTLRGPAGDMLEKYKGKQDELLDKVYAEIGQYDDIILADYEDTYFNLSWKTVTNLRWISAFCNKDQGDFFMIIDDDHRMNVKLIEKFKRTTWRKLLRTSLHGRIGFRDPVFRSPRQKWFMTYHEVPWNYVSPYPRGMSQLIGADIVDSMAIATAYTKHSYLNEDVYLGVVTQKLGIKLQSLHGLYDHGEYGRVNSERNPPIVALKKYFE